MDIKDLLSGYPFDSSVEEQEEYINNVSNDIYGSEAGLKASLLEALNPKEGAGDARVFDFDRDRVICSVDDMLDFKKILSTVRYYVAKNVEVIKKLQQERDSAKTKLDEAEKKYERANAEISALKNKQKKYKKGVIASVAVALGLLVTVSVPITMMAKDKANLQAQLEAERAEKLELIQENEDAKNLLLNGVLDKDKYKDRSLTEVIEELGLKSNGETKKEVNSAYEMIVKILEDNGITLSDIYDEEKGEYDVSKLDESVRGVFEYFRNSVNELSALEEKVSSALEFLKIPETVDENGNTITYKTIDSYDSLGKAIDDVVLFSKEYSDKKIAEIKSAIDDQFKSAGLAFTVDKDFGGDVFVAIESMESVYAKHIKDDCTTYQGVINYLNGLAKDYEELQEKYSILQGDYKELQDQYKENDGTISGGGQHGSESEKNEETSETTPVADESKNEETNDTGSAGDKSTEKNDNREDVR